MISAPAVDGYKTRYFLYRPNGEVVKPDRSVQKVRRDEIQGNDVTTNLTHGSDVTNSTHENSIIKTDNLKRSSGIIGPQFARSDVIALENRSATFKIFNLNSKEAYNSTKDVFAEQLMAMKPTDFMVGPLGEGDHGNWVISVYYQDWNLGDVEMFQVVSVEIVGMVIVIADLD